MQLPTPSFYQPAFGDTAVKPAPLPSTKTPSGNAIPTTPKQSASAEPDNNFLHNGLYRYIGFVNDAGEAFEPLIGHKGVQASYKVVALYTLTDMFLSGFRAFNRTKHQTGDESKSLFEGVAKAVDTFLFQMMASYYVLPWIIGQIRVQSGKLLGHKKLANTLVQKNAFLKKYTPVAIAMAAIPILVHPIDKAFEKILDWTYRPLVDKVIRPKVMTKIDEKKASQTSVASKLKLQTEQSRSSLKQPITFTYFSA